MTLLRRLVFLGVNLNKLGKRSSLIDAAYQQKKVEAEVPVRILLSAGADPAVRNVHGSTPLHTCAYFGRVDALCTLLDALQQAAIQPIHPDLADERGNTPLVAASASTAESSVKQRKACVQMLLDAGANATKAFITGAHKSVLQMLGAAAGTAIDENEVQRVTAHAAKDGRAVKDQWTDGMERAVAAGVLTKNELAGLTKRLVKAANNARRAQPMEEQLEDLKACTVGDRATWMPAGSFVSLHSLEAKPEMNGSRGRLISYDPAKGR